MTISPSCSTTYVAPSVGRKATSTGWSKPSILVSATTGSPSGAPLVGAGLVAPVAAGADSAVDGAVVALAAVVPGAAAAVVAGVDPTPLTDTSDELSEQPTASTARTVVVYIANLLRRVIPL